MTDEFKPGDVVQLKSGGPRMTVKAVREPDEVICVWFEKTKRYEDVFDAPLIALHKPSGPMIFTV